jgi:hypothetical protein
LRGVGVIWKPHSATIPIEAFEIVAAFAAEDEEVPTEEIGTDHLLGLRGKAVKPIALINGAASEKDFCSGRQADHASRFMARSIRNNAFSLPEASTLIRVPFGSVISIEASPPDSHPCRPSSGWRRY